MLSLEQLFSGGKQALQGGVKTLEELFSPSATQTPSTANSTPSTTTLGTSGSLGKGFVQGASALNAELANLRKANTNPEQSMQQAVDAGMGATGPMAVAGVASRVGKPLVKAGLDATVKGAKKLLSNTPLKSVGDDLLAQANKFDNGKDFYELSGAKVAQQLRDKGIRGQEQVSRWWEQNATKPIKGGKLDYMMGHRPSELGAGHDISANGAIPKDVYTNPEYYFNMKDKSYQESFNILKKIRNNPEAEVTIYRAGPKNEFNKGDWISLSPTYAKGESQLEKTKVWSKKVKAKDIHFAGDDLNEFGYFPK